MLMADVLVLIWCFCPFVILYVLKIILCKFKRGLFKQQADLWWLLIMAALLLQHSSRRRHLHWGFLDLHINSNAQAQTPAIHLTLPHPHPILPPTSPATLPTTTNNPYPTLTDSLKSLDPALHFQLPFSSRSYGMCLLALLGDSRGWWFGLAKVGLDEELDKEHKVAEVHEGRPHNVLHVGWTLLALLHPRVHQVVDHTAHQHLGDLGQCDKHGELAWQLEASRPQGVVRVHDSVDQVVHGHEPSAASYHVFVGVPGVEQHGNVMIPVEED